MQVIALPDELTGPCPGWPNGTPTMLDLHNDESRGLVVAARHVYLILGHSSAATPDRLIRADNLAPHIRGALGISANETLPRTSVPFPTRTAEEQVTLTMSEAVRCVIKSPRDKERRLKFLMVLADHLAPAPRLTNAELVACYASSPSKDQLTDNLIDAILQHGDDKLKQRAVGRLLRGSEKEKGYTAGGRLLSMRELVDPALLGQAVAALYPGCTSKIWS